MKNNLLTAVLAALLCLLLAACGTAGTINHSAGTTAGPVISIEDTERLAALSKDPEPASSWDVTDDITFSLLQDAYPVGTEKLTMVLENRGDEELTYGEELSFEKYADGRWKYIETIDKYYFHSEAWTLPPHTTQTFTISPWFLKKPLSSGLYRVTGGEMYTGTDERVKQPAWQLEFRVSVDASPEPDYTVFVSSQPLQDPETISAYIVNTTGADSSVLLIPRLDRQTDGGQWEEVAYADGVGFCGMSDPLPAAGRNVSEPVETLWGWLRPGRYRLSYDITGGETATRTAGGEFLLERQRCGLPLVNAAQ